MQDQQAKSTGILKGSICAEERKSKGWILSINYCTNLINSIDKCKLIK